MEKYKGWFWLFGVLLFWSFVYIIVNYFAFNNYFKSVNIGEKYIYIHTPVHYNKNPFERRDRVIDTIKILDIKEGYVQWMELTNDSTIRSWKKKFFKDRIEDIKHKAK